MHEPRGKVGVGLGYATNEAGADHLVGFHDPLFVKADSVPFRAVADARHHASRPGCWTSARRRSAIWYTSERWNSAEKVLGLCFFGPAPRSFIQVDDVRGGRAGRDGLGRHGRRAAGGRRAGREHGPRLQRAGGLHAGRRSAPGPPPHPARERRARGHVDRPGRLRAGASRTSTCSRAGTRRRASRRAERLRALGLEWTAGETAARGGGGGASGGEGAAADPGR